MDELDAYVMPDGYGTTIGKCLTYGEIEALLAAEREQCAKVVDQMGQGAGLSLSRLALSVTAKAICSPPAGRWRPAVSALRQIAGHRIMMFAWAIGILALLAWVLSTDPPHEVIFAFVTGFGALAMVLAYQQGHSDAVKWARSLLPDD